MHSTTKTIKRTVWNMILAFSIGVPITILAFWASCVPDYSIFLLPLLFGGAGGRLWIFVYFFYSYLFIRNRKSGCILILCLHYGSLFVLAMLWQLGYYSPNIQLHSIHSLPQKMKVLMYIFSIPAILLFIIFNVFLFGNLFKTNYDENALYNNRYSVIRFGCIATIFIVGAITIISFFSAASFFFFMW